MKLISIIAAILVPNRWVMVYSARGLFGPHHELSFYLGHLFYFILAMIREHLAMTMKTA